MPTEVERKPITAILHNVQKQGDRLCGNIEADSNNRFRDGELVTTSRITSRHKNVFRTLNSVYYVASWGPQP